ncbi:flavin reductase family protein [Jatrophihabitans sp.]|jgi:flavin reductase (DIM6/NTAB) family NADH-FMN oxidoreductase RutF|uniref:flavin reductase family protein n=1 Tax=Jatrophihabitans sp. TaxID=1932789 RepID=UPI002EE48114
MTAKLTIDVSETEKLVENGDGTAEALAGKLSEVFRTEVPGALCRVDGAAFRDVMASLPTAVSVVTAIDPDGAPRGLTCSAVCSVSADPPQVLVCINQRNGSLAAIRHSGAFVVNVLGSTSAGLSDQFASSAAEKFSDVDWRPAPNSGLPVLDGSAHAFIDCELTADITAGSHSILVGAVQACGTDIDSMHPLLYWRRAYGTWLQHES